MTDPIPTKFEKGEDALLRLLAHRNGVSNSEVLRRSVRILWTELKRRGPDWNWLRDTSEPVNDPDIIAQWEDIVSDPNYEPPARGRKPKKTTTPSEAEKAARLVERVEEKVRGTNPARRSGPSKTGAGRPVEKR